MKPILYVLIVDLPESSWRKSKSAFIEVLRELDRNNYFMIVTEDTYTFCDTAGEAVAAVKNLVSNYTKIPSLVVPILEICEESDFDLRCLHLTDKGMVSTPYKIDEKIDSYGINGRWEVMSISDDSFEELVEQWIEK